MKSGNLKRLHRRLFLIPRNKIIRHLISLSFVLLGVNLPVFSCSPSARFASTKANDRFPTTGSEESGEVFSGEASYYGPKFHGRKTANGEIFDMYKKSAAHRTLPFNTILEVTNLDNQKRVIVRVNDRGPFVKGRILDLSYEAAREIDMISSGVARVSVRILKTGTQ